MEKFIVYSNKALNLSVTQRARTLTTIKGDSETMVIIVFALFGHFPTVHININPTGKSKTRDTAVKVSLRSQEEGKVPGNGDGIFSLPALNQAFLL